MDGKSEILALNFNGGCDMPDGIGGTILIKTKPWEVDPGVFEPGEWRIGYVDKDGVHTANRDGTAVFPFSDKKLWEEIVEKWAVVE